MSVILILFTFAIFIAADWLVHRNRKPAVITNDISETPTRLKFHPGHTWVAPEREKVVRIGIDAIAAEFLGHVDSIEPPKVGRWMRQGDKGFTVMVRNQRVDLVSPVEGEVVEINPKILANPDLIRQDPYGQGWICTVHAPDEEAMTRNLLPAELVEPWMRMAVHKMGRSQSGKEFFLQ